MLESWSNGNLNTNFHEKAMETNPHTEHNNHISKHYITYMVCCDSHSDYLCISNNTTLSLVQLLL